MKILAVGMNYAKHNKELDGTLYKPEEPVIFTKPDSALLKDGKPFFIPDFTKQCDYEAELVVRICRLGKNIAPRFAYRYYDAVTVGIDFTARDLQRKFRKEGLPWELCKGFDGSAVVGASRHPAAPVPFGHRRPDGAGGLFGRHALCGGRDYRFRQSLLHVEDGRPAVHRYSFRRGSGERGTTPARLPPRTQGIGFLCEVTA